MYKDVSRKTYTSNDLARTYRDIDLRRFKITKTDFETKADNTAERFATDQGYIKKIIVSPRPKKKHLFTLPHLEDHLLIRQTSKILKRYLRLQSFSRDAEVRQLMSIIASEPNATILRTDIRSFFESVNFKSTLSDLRKSGFNNPSALKYLESFVQVGNEHGSLGLPRGLSISSLLADFSMRNFDKKAKLIRSCCYYCRYVDDILLVTTNKKIEIIDEIKDILPNNLELNPDKTEKKQIGALDSVDFLGYSIDLKNPQNVQIAFSKISRAKKRIDLSFKKFLKERDFDLLCKRISFLSTNTIMQMSSREKPLIVGYRYSYPLATEDSVSSQMKELDNYYYGILNSHRYFVSKRLASVLTASQKKQLRYHSFYQAFQKRITYRLSPVEIQKIKQAWVHA